MEPDHDALHHGVPPPSPAQVRDDEDFTWLMADPRGRRLMWRQLLAPAGVFRNPYAGERGATDFNCGQMNAGLRLLARIHALCPEKYSLMVQESTHD